MVASPIEIPDALLQLIFTLVFTPAALARCSLVCKDWRRILSSVALWRRITHKMCTLADSPMRYGGLVVRLKCPYGQFDIPLQEKAGDVYAVCRTNLKCFDIVIDVLFFATGLFVAVRASVAMGWGARLRDPWGPCERNARYTLCLLTDESITPKHTTATAGDPHQTETEARPVLQSHSNSNSSSHSGSGGSSSERQR